MRGTGIPPAVSVLPNIHSPCISHPVTPKAEPVIAYAEASGNQTTGCTSEKEVVSEPETSGQSDPKEDSLKPKPQTLNAASTVTRAGRVVTLHVGLFMLLFTCLPLCYFLILQLYLLGLISTCFLKNFHSLMIFHSVIFQWLPSISILIFSVAGVEDGYHFWKSSSTSFVM